MLRCVVGKEKVGVGVEVTACVIIPEEIFRFQILALSKTLQYEIKSAEV